MNLEGLNNKGFNHPVLSGYNNCNIDCNCSNDLANLRNSKILLNDICESNPIITDNKWNITVGNSIGIGPFLTNSN